MTDPQADRVDSPGYAGGAAPARPDDAASRVPSDPYGAPAPGPGSAAGLARSSAPPAVAGPSDANAAPAPAAAPALPNLPHNILNAEPGPAKPVPMSVKPRSRSSVVPRSAVPPRSKLRQASFSADQPSLKPLNTHSPIAMAAAAAVTAEKIRKLLVAQGPLPIRHITSHLAATITGFGELSLSKQRRLIIAVLDGPKSEFVKVGWGRWAVEGFGTDRKELVGSPPQSGLAASPAGSQHSSPASGSSPATGSPPFGPGAAGAAGAAPIPGVVLPATGGYAGPRFSSGLNAHRESISRQLPNSKPPLSPSLGPIEDAAVFSDTESSDDGDFDDSEVEGTDEEDWRAMGPTRLRQTSPREQDAIAALVQLRSN